MKKEEFIKAMLKLGWEEDRYGHLQKDVKSNSGVGRWRCKLQATSCRMEKQIVYEASEWRKAENAWCRMDGDYYKNISESKFGIKIGRMLIKYPSDTKESDQPGIKYTWG